MIPERAARTPGSHYFWADCALWVAVWAPFVAVAAVRAKIHWFPIQDQAVLDMRVRGLLHGRDIPLVGAFSRFRWSHPGPIWFYVLSPFRALGGTDGLLAGSIVLFGAGIATLPVLVRRRYGLAVTVVAVVTLIPALMAAGSFTILVSWNPHLAFAWLPVFLVLALGAIERSPKDLGPALFVGAMLIQLHVGYLFIVALPMALVVVIVVRRHGVNELRRRAVAARRWLIATLLFYVPPVLEQLEHGIHGNAGKIARFFVIPPHGLGGHAGFAFAAGTLGGVLRWPLTGLGGGGERVEPFTGYLVADPAWRVLPVVAALVATYLIARRSRAQSVEDAALFVGVLLCACLLSLSRLVGERWSYIFTWRFDVVWFVVATVALGVAALLRLPRPTTPTRRNGKHAAMFRWCALAAAVAALGFAVVAKSVSAPYGRILPFERSTERLARTVRTRGRPHVVVDVVRFDGSLVGVADGIMNELDAEGWHVGASKDLAYKYGDSHAISDSEPRETWFVSETSRGTTLAAAIPDARVIAAVTPLPKAEDRELARLQRELIGRLRAARHLELLPAVDFPLVEFAVAGRVSLTGIDMHRLAQLNDKVARSDTGRFAITVVPRGTADDVTRLASTLPGSALNPRSG